MMKNLIYMLLLTPMAAMCSTNEFYTDMTKPGINWAAVEIDNELVEVANQIQAAVRTYDGYAEPLNTNGENAASADPSDADHWTHYEMQKFVDDNFDKFVREDFTTIEGYTNDGLNSFEYAYTNIIDFYADAGMKTSGWRRCVSSWPSDWGNMADSAYTNGRVTLGDYRGPWVIDDLQLALDAMTRQIIGNVYWLLETGTNVPNAAATTQYSYSRLGETFDTAKTDAIADWTAKLYVNPYPYPKSMVASYSTVSGTNESWICTLSTKSLNPRISISTNSTHTVRFFARAEKDTWISGAPHINNYDDQGSGLIENTWTEVGTIQTNTLHTLPDNYAWGELIGPIEIPSNIPTPQSNIWVEAGWTLNYTSGAGGQDAADITYKWKYTRP